MALLLQTGFLSPPVSLIALPKPPSSSPAATTRRSSLRPPSPHRHPLRASVSRPQIPEDEGPEELVEPLRVPDGWLAPSGALQESEWLRVALLKWLDDEYCPEEANLDISKVAARSYYESLIAKQADLGVILLKMAMDLESLSFQESFHGPFSSANAAIDLITQRIDSLASV